MLASLVPKVLLLVVEAGNIRAQRSRLIATRPVMQVIVFGELIVRWLKVMLVIEMMEMLVVVMLQVLLAGRRLWTLLNQVLLELQVMLMLRMLVVVVANQVIARRLTCRSMLLLL